MHFFFQLSLSGINLNRTFSPFLTHLKTDFPALVMIAKKKKKERKKSMFQRCALKIDAHTGMCWEMVTFSLQGCKKSGGLVGGDKQNQQ